MSRLQKLITTHLKLQCDFDDMGTERAQATKSCFIQTMAARGIRRLVNAYESEIGEDGAWTERAGADRVLRST